MRIVSPEFGSLDRHQLNPRALSRLKKLGQPYVANGRPVFDWSDSNRLRVQNYVGVVQVPGLTIEILPKVGSPPEALIDPEIPVPAEWAQAQKNLLFMLTVAEYIPFKEWDLASLRTTRMPLFEALVSAFGRRLMKELRRGLDRAYVRREENLSVVRGKLLTGIHLRVNAVRPDRLYIAYDDFNADTLLNRVLKRTCQRLLPLAALAGTQQLLRECLIDLADVEETDVTKECFDRIHLSRNSERFSALLEFCRLVLLGTPPELGAGGVETFSLLFPMERLFERFIGQLIRRHAEHLGLNHNQVLLQSAGKTRWLVHTPEGQGRFRLKPDILILDHARTVQTILDTKWKRLKGDVEDTKNGIGEGDMYQLFAYADRFQSPDNVLLYPAVEGVIGKEYQVVDGRSVRKIRVETVNLNRDLAMERSAFLSDLRKVLRLNVSASAS